MQAIATCVFAACSSGHLGPIGNLSRPPQLVGEWVDVHHSTTADTSVWVLRPNGYDGVAHLIAKRNADGSVAYRRTEQRYAWWYFNGALADSAHRAICFSKRIGRDGATCLPFSLDSTDPVGTVKRRLIIRGYKGQHTTADRELIERRP